MVNEGIMFLKARRTLVNSQLFPLLVCEQDKVASQKGLVVHSKVASCQVLGLEKKGLQHNIVDLFPGIPTDPDR